MLLAVAVVKMDLERLSGDYASGEHNCECANLNSPGRANPGPCRAAQSGMAITKHQRPSSTHRTSSNRGVASRRLIRSNGCPITVPDRTENGQSAYSVFKHGEDESYLVLQNSSGPAPFFGGPGLILQFDSPGSAPMVLADCLARPTSMLRDAKSGRLYVTELLTGRIVALDLGSVESDRPPSGSRALACVNDE